MLVSFIGNLNWYYWGSGCWFRLVCRVLYVGFVLKEQVVWRGKNVRVSLTVRLYWVPGMGLCSFDHLEDDYRFLV